MKLFEPGKIGRLHLKNRIIMAAMLTGLNEPTEKGRLSQRAIDFYVARARGGTGLIIPSTMRPSTRIEVSWIEPVVDSERCIRWLNDLAEAVHDYSAKVCVQLTAGFGCIFPPNPSLPHGGTVSASPIPCFWNPDIITRELSVEEIEGLVADYELSCKIISSAGIDAIEIHAHEGYLIDQFVTSLWNRRTDKYGGDLDGRLRLPLELLAAAKRGAGTDFPIIYRYGLTHYLEGGRDIEEGLEIARRLEAAGVNALHINAGCYESNNLAQPPTAQPPGLLVDLAEMTKKSVNIPVITVGKLGYPELANRVLEEGKADFIALARPLLADPEWPNKVKEGRPEDITPCTGCHDGCIQRLLDGKHVSCAVNPACGRERESIIGTAEKKKCVVIVGGGPAGMEAARVAALRGHHVTLWEKGYALGGNLIPAAGPDFKQDYKLLLGYLVTQIRKLRVVTKLGQEATPDLIQKMNPDAVIVATGATPIIPEIPGIQKVIGKRKLVTATDVLLGKKDVGKLALVIGAGLVGCETALFLAQEGKKVIVVELYDAMRDTCWINAFDLKMRLDKANVKIFTNSNVLEITDNAVVIADEQGKKNSLQANTIVLATGWKPNVELLEALQDRLPEVYSVGDCVEPRQVMSAMWEGFHTARLI